MSRLSDEMNQRLADRTTEQIVVLVNKGRQQTANSIYEMLVDIEEQGGNLKVAIALMSKALKEGRFAIKDGNQKSP